MAFASRRADKTTGRMRCVVCGASLAHVPSTITIVLRTGIAHETTWTSCGCGAMCRSERVRAVAFVQSRMSDS